MESFYQEVSCALCGATSYRVRYPANFPDRLIETGELFDFHKLGYMTHYQIVECEGCGFVYSNPILKEEIINRFYQGSKDESFGYSPEDIIQVRKNMMGYFHSFEPYLTGRNSALDIGCYMGILLEILKDQNFEDLHGVEPSLEDIPNQAQFAKEASIVTDIYKKDMYRESQFDLITAIHVLDHVVNPGEFLKNIQFHLKKGGIFYCVTHDINCLLSKVFGERFPVINVQHLSFFTRNSLKQLVESSGLKLVKILPANTNYTLAGYLERSPLSFKNPLIRLLKTCSLDQVSLSLPLGNIAAICQNN